MDTTDNDEKILCYKCKGYYPIEFFILTPIRKFHSACLNCRRKKAAERMRKYFESNEDYRIRHKIRQKTRYLIKSGKLIIEYKCKKCGYQNNLQLHHPKPYDPYNAYYLCRKVCHEEEHNTSSK